MNTSNFIERYKGDDVVLSALRNALRELDFLAQETTIRLNHHFEIIEIDDNVIGLIRDAIDKLEKG